MAPLGDISIEGFESVKAELDFETGTASTPITPYLNGFDVEVRVAEAREKFLERCMSESGFACSGHSSVKWGSLKPMEDRLYGMWDVKSAAKHGLDLNPSRGVPKGGIGVGEGQGAVDAIDACVSKMAEDPAFGVIIETLEAPSSIAERIHGNASGMAQESEPGKAATEKFKQCMQGRGLVLSPDSGYVSSDYSEQGKGAEIKAAVGEAECNIETGRIQTMYDLQARYEAAYMKKYESQLAEVLAEKKAMLTKLDEILAGEPN